MDATRSISLGVLLAASAGLQEAVAVEKVRIEGTRVQASEAAQGEPLALVGKRGVMAVLTSSLNDYCATQTVGVEHRGGEYLLDGESLDLTALLEAVGERADALRCLRVHGDRPDRPAVDRLKATLVDEAGMTVLLPTSD
ncbi:MAG: hypothetical protein U0S76_11455 [Pseudoxanthomonas sp.]|nr:hypothetical protein [Pseudoxanthomonas sp.]